MTFLWYDKYKCVQVGDMIHLLPEFKKVDHKVGKKDQNKGLECNLDRQFMLISGNSSVDVVDAEVIVNVGSLWIVEVVIVVDTEVVVVAAGMRTNSIDFLLYRTFFYKHPLPQ
jgi:hypothetical protein